jgi:hypothetical protein
LVFREKAGLFVLKDSVGGAVSTAADVVAERFLNIMLVPAERLGDRQQETPDRGEPGQADPADTATAEIPDPARI